MKKRLVDVIAFAGLWSIIRCTQLTSSRRVGCAIFKTLLFFTWFFWKSRRHVTMKNLKILHKDSSEEELKKTAFNVYMKWGEFLGEYPLLNRKNLKKNVRIKNMEIMREAFRRGKGVIVPTAHHGNFEWMNAALAVSGLPVYSVIREADNRHIDRLLNSIRSKAGVTAIKSRYGAASVLRNIRKGNVVTIATDQNASSNGVFVKFMGRWTATVKTPAVIHLRTKAPIIPIYCVREKDNSHTLRVLPEIKIEPTGDLKRDVFLITQKIADAQEKFIAETPELWFWLHKRWKTGPSEKEIVAINNLASITANAGQPANRQTV